MYGTGGLKMCTDPPSPYFSNGIALKGGGLPAEVNEKSPDMAKVKQSKIV